MSENDSTKGKRNNSSKILDSQTLSKPSWQQDYNAKVPKQITFTTTLKENPLSNKRLIAYFHEIPKTTYNMDFNYWLIQELVEHSN